MSLSSRDKFIRYLDPLSIFWEDADGHVHASLGNACKAVGLEPTEENMAMVRPSIEEGMRRAHPKATLVYRPKPDSPEFFEQ